MAVFSSIPAPASKVFTDSTTGCSSTNEAAFQSCRQAYYTKQQNEILTNQNLEKQNLENQNRNAQIQITSLQENSNSLRSNYAQLKREENTFFYSFLGVLFLFAVSLVAFMVFVKRKQ